ncbi:MAG TPA: hypothetical protein VMH04_16135 [Candidatus Solibacter sp.]|nr:hypothetical protein [Candidatus Solibacter sp.]
MKRLAWNGIGLVLSLSLLGFTASAQNQTSPDSQSSGSSLGDYARQVRKSPNAGKPKVFDNDNLPTEDKLSVVGPAAAATTADASSDSKPADSAVAPAAGEAKTVDAKASTEIKGETSQAKEDAKAATSKAKTPEEEQAEKEAAWKQWGAKINAQKEQIDLLTRELDVLQREYQIRAAAMYADAGNRMRNSADWDKQDAQYKQQIADKQKALDDAKQKLEDAQEDARKAGVPASVREP